MTTLTTKSNRHPLATDRRFASRQGARADAVLRDEFGGETAGELIDLSEEGAGLWVQSCESLSTRITLEFSSVNVPQPIAVPAVVVNTREVLPGVWRIGVRFLRRLSVFEVASALS